MPKMNAVVVAELLEEVNELAVVEVEEVDLWSAMEDALSEGNWELYSDLYKERHGCRP
jgi:hypothetical protein